MAVTPARSAPRRRVRGGAGTSAPVRALRGSARVESGDWRRPRASRRRVTAGIVLTQGEMLNSCAGTRHGRPDSLPTSLPGAPSRNTVLAFTASENLRRGLRGHALTPRSDRSRQSQDLPDQTATSGPRCRGSEAQSSTSPTVHAGGRARSSSGNLRSQRPVTTGCSSRRRGVTALGQVVGLRVGETSLASVARVYDAAADQVAGPGALRLERP